MSDTGHVHDWQPYPDPLPQFCSNATMWAGLRAYVRCAGCGGRTFLTPEQFEASRHAVTLRDDPPQTVPIHADTVNALIVYLELRPTADGIAPNLLHRIRADVARANRNGPET